MAFRYHFGGVDIDSEIALPSLRPGNTGDWATPAVRVVAASGPAPAEDKLHFAWVGRFGIRLGEAGGQWLVGSDWGAFEIARDASIVRVFGLGESDYNDLILADILSRRVLPRLVTLKGAATYHAGSLARGDKAVLLMGESGAGKSTMSAGLAAIEGWDLLGDDMAFVWNEGAETIAPAAADVTIWPQSCTGLGLDAADCTPQLGYDGKRVYRPRAARLDSVPLAGIFFLRRTPDCAAPTLERCSRADAFQRALRQVVRFNPSGEAAEERVQSVLRLSALLGRIPAWTLTYPAAFDALGSVSDTISETLAAD